MTNLMAMQYLLKVGYLLISIHKIISDQYLLKIS